MFRVSNVIESSAHLTIGMKTTVVAWSDVASDYDFDFGKATLNQAQHRLKGRGFWGDIANVGNTILQAAKGDANLDESVTFNVNVGESGKKTNVYKDSKSRLSIDCVDCFVTGSWEVEGRVTVCISLTSTCLVRISLTF